MAGARAAANYGCTRRGRDAKPIGPRVAAGNARITDGACACARSTHSKSYCIADGADRRPAGEGARRIHAVQADKVFSHVHALAWLQGGRGRGRDARETSLACRERVKQTAVAEIAR